MRACFLQVSMDEYSRIIKVYNKKNPIKNIFEIGSLHGHDANKLHETFAANKPEVHIFEPHPIAYKNIIKTYPDYQTYNYIVGDEDVRKKDFWCRDLRIEAGNGTSSVFGNSKKKGFLKIPKQQIRMDTFMSEKNIRTIDVLKIDVEGFLFQVLQGFGERIKDIKSMHIETEYIPVWKGQVTNPKVEEFLIKNKFILIKSKALWPQSDQVWVSAETIKQTGITLKEFLRV